jgi:hypothetical protein
MTPEHARRAAYASLGGPPVIVREACRDQRGVSMVEDFVKDLAYGARFLRRNRSFAVMSVFTLAISARTDGPTRVLVFMVVPKGSPLTAPVWSLQRTSGGGRDTTA